MFAIELDGVSKAYRGRDGSTVRAVDEVSLGVERGQTLGLIGTSGCGKTTTMRLINRLVEPSTGRVLVDGRDVREQDPIALRRSIGYVIQKGGLFPHMTVARNVGLLCELERWEPSRTNARVAELLALVNLPIETFGDRHPLELSGGQRQRVGVARALALDPPIVLMDEPFGALDPISRSRIHTEFIELKRSVQKTIVMVTHDMAEAFKLADEVVLMSEGRIVQRGTEADFRERPANAFVEEFVRA